MTYTIGNMQRKTRYAETPAGVLQIPAMSEFTADLDDGSLLKLLAQGFKLGAQRASSAPPVAPAPVPKVVTANVVDSGDLGAVNAGKLKKSKSYKKDDSDSESNPGFPGQES